MAVKFPSRATARNFNGIDYTRILGGRIHRRRTSDVAEVDGQTLTTIDDLISFAQGRGANLYLEIEESAYFRPRAGSGSHIGEHLRARGLAERGSPFWIQSEQPRRPAGAATAGRQSLGLSDSTWDRKTSGCSPRSGSSPMSQECPMTRAGANSSSRHTQPTSAVACLDPAGSRDAYRKAAAIGADGVITDFPDLGVDVRNRQRWAIGQPGSSAGSITATQS